MAENRHGKQVSAELRKEIDGYNRLMRTMRVKHLLDLTGDLTRYAVEKRVAEVQLIRRLEDEDGKLGYSVTEENIPDAFKLVPPSLKDKQDASCAIQQKSRRKKPKRIYIRDTWTRWPLLVNDIARPEFTIEEEIQGIAIKAVQRNWHAALRAADEPQPDPDDLASFEVDPEAYFADGHLDATADLGKGYLESILCALVRAMPKTAMSMFNRTKPLDWMDVLQVASCAGLASPE
jgi:hypothetical protein